MAEDSDQKELAIRLERTLLRSGLAEKQLIQPLTSVLHRSVEYGRAKRVLGTNPSDLEIREYVQNVIDLYRRHHLQVNKLERREEEAWTSMIDKIYQWANSYLKNQNISGLLRDKCVGACVPNAVIGFLSSVYHYDTEFDAWFCVLVQNTCRKYIKEQTNPIREVENRAVSLNQVGYLLETITDQRERNSRRRRELRATLLDTIEKLSTDSRKKLILLRYFSGYSFKEIGKEMGKSMTAVYKMHFDALNELRTILEDEEN